MRNVVEYLQSLRFRINFFSRRKTTFLGFCFFYRVEIFTNRGREIRCAGRWRRKIFLLIFSFFFKSKLWLGKLRSVHTRILITLLSRKPFGSFFFLTNYAHTYMHKTLEDEFFLLHLNRPLFFIYGCKLH